MVWKLPHQEVSVVFTTVPHSHSSSCPFSLVSFLVSRWFVWGGCPRHHGQICLCKVSVIAFIHLIPWPCSVTHVASSFQVCFWAVGPRTHPQWTQNIPLELPVREHGWWCYCLCSYFCWTDWSLHLQQSFHMSLSWCGSFLFVLFLHSHRLWRNTQLTESMSTPSTRLWSSLTESKRSMWVFRFVRVWKHRKLRCISSLNAPAYLQNVMVFSLSPGFGLSSIWRHSEPEEPSARLLFAGRLRNRPQRHPRSSILHLFWPMGEVHLPLAYIWLLSG